MMVWGKKADGTDDVAVFTGTAEWDGQRLVMLRGHGEPPLEVQGEWLDRLKPVDPDRPDNLWEPVDQPRGEDHGAHGEFDDRSHRRSAQLLVSHHPVAAMATAVAAAAAGLALASRARRR